MWLLAKCVPLFRQSKNQFKNLARLRASDTHKPFKKRFMPRLSRMRGD